MIEPGMLNALVALGLILLIVGGGWLIRRSEERKWNHGVCPYCEKGFWRQFDMASDGSRGYKCTCCEEHIWLSWGVDK